MHPVRNVGNWDRAVSVVAAALLAHQAWRRGGSTGALLAAGAAELLRRSFTAHCFGYEALGVHTNWASDGANQVFPWAAGVHVEERVTIRKPAREVYWFWRNLDNLPRFMDRVKAVTQFDNKRSHWILQGLGSQRLEWDAEIINDIPEELIGWRTLNGADFASAGSVHFTPGGDEATEVRLRLQYDPPAGKAGALLARVVGEDPAAELRRDLFRLKQLMESGKIAVA